MTAKAEAELKITNWDERPYRQEPGECMLPRASITKTYQGGIQGQASLEYLMTYREDESASFVGHERIKGQLAGRSGSFVFHHIGTYDDGIARAPLTVIPGSGTEELSGLIGEGEFEAGHADSHPLSLIYDFDGQAAQGNTTNLSES